MSKLIINNHYDKISGTKSIEKSTMQTEPTETIIGMCEGGVILEDIIEPVLTEEEWELPECNLAT